MIFTSCSSLTKEFDKNQARCNTLKLHIQIPCKESIINHYNNVLIGIIKERVINLLPIKNELFDLYKQDKEEIDQTLAKMFAGKNTEDENRKALDDEAIPEKLATGNRRAATRNRARCSKTRRATTCNRARC